MIVLAILSIVLFVAVPAYQGYVERARVERAKADLAEISIKAERFFTENSRYPETLAEIDEAGRLDPWDSTYQFLRIAGAGPGIRGRVRKDKNLVPVNSDFDLYSMGPDGESRPPFTARASRDDIVRCGNGAYFGIADEY